jgi:hypothetical protein
VVARSVDISQEARSLDYSHTKSCDGVAVPCSVDSHFYSCRHWKRFFVYLFIKGYRATPNTERKYWVIPMLLACRTHADQTARSFTAQAISCRPSAKRFSDWTADQSAWQRCMSLHSGRTDRRSLDLQGDVGSDRVWDMPFPLIPLLAGAVLGKKASKKKKPEEKIAVSKSTRILKDGTKVKVKQHLRKAKRSR